MDDNALTDAERDRLDRFATAFERLSASEYAMFAVEGDVGPWPETVERAGIG